ncbi:CdaR family protein [Pseudoflavonifractor phocaeensis]|uniref:CdaR family protein n=1 Tax=Pseudoflavonifractor phocaeensis TaxID=1870988 RepID=UPI0025A4406F|nr:CdaR family protein [Pseudoflavonifractor phocaeensis]MDM8237883.1 CdaR family protein [Pseudoflavonifractor phocaeensis]
MIDRLRESRWFYILLSVLLAVLIWMYIRDVENPTQEGTYYGVEIQISGERVLEERGLTVASISQKTVNVTVNAPISVHNDLRGNITATVDVSQCTEPGEYQLTCTPKLPSNIDTTGAYFPDSAQVVTVVIDNLATETKTLELKLEGSVADGYQAGAPVFDPETVELSGTAEQLAQVSRAVVILEADGLKQSYSGRLPITLLDENDEPITDTNISMSEETAYLTLPVGVMKEVPLTVSFIPGGGATGDGDVEVDIQPKTINVIGTEEAVAGLTEISLGSIDLSTVLDTSVITMPIRLSSALDNASGITEAQVTVTIKGLSTRSLDVSNIEITNVPDGYTVEKVTQTRTIVIRGSESALEQVDPNQVWIVADMSKITATGTNSVPVTVYLNASDEVGVVGEYKIVVNIKKK